MTESSSARGQVSTPTPPPPLSGFSSSFSAYASAPSASQSGTPQPNYQSSAFAPPPKPTPDPFASLNSHVISKPAAQPSGPGGGSFPANDDDEWSFSSALPPEVPALPREHNIIVSNEAIKIELLAHRSTSTPNAITVLFSFTNNTAQPISELHFQTAVTKVSFSLCLATEPASSRLIKTLLLGIRATNEAAVRARATAKAEPRGHAIDGRVACRQQGSKGRGHQIQVESIVQVGRRAEERYGRNRGVPPWVSRRGGSLLGKEGVAPLFRPSGGKNKKMYKCARRLLSSCHLGRQPDSGRGAILDAICQTRKNDYERGNEHETSMRRAAALCKARDDQALKSPHYVLSPIFFSSFLFLQDHEGWTDTISR